MSTENEVNEASNNEEVIQTSYEINAWEDLELPETLLRGIYSYGFERPSPIQQKAIKPIMMGRDIIAQAQSGTGKTATFSIGALSKIDMEKNATQVLILSPTRELTSQTSRVITSLGDMLENSKKERLRVQTVFGGANYEEKSSFSNKNIPHVICGCPGRV
jgi:translation initiation factor 4A